MITLKGINWKNPVIIIVISLLSGIISSFGTLFLQNIFSNKQREAILQQELFTKRIEIIDDFATIFGKSDATKDLWALYDYGRKNGSNTDTQLELNNQISAYISEFARILTLSGIYFGPKTINELNNYNKKDIIYWDVDRAENRALIAAMRSEIYYIPKNN